MAPTTHQLKAAPLSFEKLESQAEKHLECVEVHKLPDGTEVQVRHLNRRAQRHAAAYERRKFKPATRPLNPRELREMYLNRYEDSLEAKQPRSRSRKATAQPTTDKPQSDLPPLPLGTSRQRRLARRAEIRRRAEAATGPESTAETL